MVEVSEYLVKIFNFIGYTGTFVQDKKYGYGTYWYPDGSIYRGHWFEGVKHQQGELQERNGRIYKVEHDKNKLISKEDITNEKIYLARAQEA